MKNYPECNEFNFTLLITQATNNMQNFLKDYYNLLSIYRLTDTNQPLNFMWIVCQQQMIHMKYLALFTV